MEKQVFINSFYIKTIQFAICIANFDYGLHQQWVLSDEM